MTRHRRRGGYLVEFALVLPVFLASFGGIVEYGRYLERHVAVVGVMRDAARVGTLQPPIADAPAVAAETTAAHGLSEQDLTGAVTATVEGTVPDKYLRVTVDVPYEPIIGLVPTPTSIRCTVVMRMQTQI